MRNKGFTMLELIMVVIIIGVLAALAVPQYSSFVEKARAAEAINHIGALKSASIAYAAEMGNAYYPANIAAVGLSNKTPMWNFTVAGTNATSVQITATRYAGTATTNGQTVILNYSTAAQNWGGDHPGVPKQ